MPNLDFVDPYFWDLIFIFIPTYFITYFIHTIIIVMNTYIKHSTAIKNH